MKCENSLVTVVPYGDIRTKAVRHSLLKLCNRIVHLCALLVIGVVIVNDVLRFLDALIETLDLRIELADGLLEHDTLVIIHDYVKSERVE